MENVLRGNSPWTCSQFIKVIRLLCVTGQPPSANTLVTGGGTFIRPSRMVFRPSANIFRHILGWRHCHSANRSRGCYFNDVGVARLSTDSSSPLLVHTTKFDINGNFITEVLKKSELLSRYNLQPRDIRFSSPSSLYIRQSSIILRLQDIKAIINPTDVVLLDSDHPSVINFLPELKEKLSTTLEVLPFEFSILESFLTKKFATLDENINELHPSILDVLNTLLDPRLFSVDRGQLHILLHLSKSLSEFSALVKDIQGTLNDVLEYEEEMAGMYLTHYLQHGEERGIDDIEEIGNILESFYMQTEDLLSRVEQLKDLIDQSESIILINLDSQRNIMMRLSLQLEMGVFAATIGGLFGLAFGMNLDSSLEENEYAFWVVTGLMVTSSGLLWRHLLTFLGKNLNSQTSFMPFLKKLNKPNP